MSARWFLLVMSLISLCYSFVIMRLSDRQRKLPLPAEVADVYDGERYRKYIEYTSDNRRLKLIHSAVELLARVAVIFSGLFAALEGALNGNVYLASLAAYGVVWLVELIPNVAADWYDTFCVRAKYGLNKKDGKEFVRDEALGQLQELVLSAGLMLLAAFVGEHMGGWTNGFTVGLSRSFLIGLGVAAAVALFMVAASFFSIWIMKRQYVFTPLEEGALRDKINALQKDSRKKVRAVNVYNESKKSTSKNAFLLKFLWIREFGIADNFLNGNSERELLAVLSHEVGHLKHKKNLLNYLRYALLALVFCAAVLLIAYPAPALSVNAWVRNSFDIGKNNYYLLVDVLMAIFTPVMRLVSVFNNYRSRSEEYEADREAVKNGLGAEMIATFKRLSSDELVNVNPHPAVEFLEYDHPGMYNRIRAIQEAEKAQSAAGMD